MMTSNCNATLVLGTHMKQFLLRLAVAASALVPASALAADIDVPPPVDDLRPANYDWSGAYVGVYGAGIATDGFYNYTCTPAGGGSCTPVMHDPEHDGIGYGGGILAGYNYQMDSIVFGVEGDWGMAGTVARNVEPGIDTYLKFDQMASARARLGLADDRTLFYVTGGLFAADMKFGGMMSTPESDNKWAVGWTVGGGIEHAFTDNITARLEYLYLGLPDTDFTMVDGAGTTFRGTQTFSDAHMVRAALAYKFNW